MQEAVRTALNVLSILEEHSPEDGRTLRRLLPALAINFARAGEDVSEDKLLSTLREAQEQNIPLASLFNSEAPRKNRIKSYAEIAARLNPGFKQSPSVSDILDFGRLDLLKRRPKRLVELDPCDEAAKAAKMGHANLCLHFIGLAEDRRAAESAALKEASKYWQYHLIYALNAPREDGDGRSGSVDSLNTESRADYRGWLRLLNDFRKSTPEIDPACLTGLESWQNVPLKLAPFLGIRDMLREEIPNVRSLNQYAFRATLLFQSPENLLRFFDRWGEKGEKPLFTLIKPLENMPITSHVDWPGWGQAALKYGPGIFFPLQFAQQIKTPCRNDDGEISLNLTRHEVLKNYEVHKPEFRRIGELCYELETKVNIVEQAINLWSRSSRYIPPPPETIPGIYLDGESIGLEGYKLTNIPHTDERIMFLGYYTGCCEKVGDHFEPTVEHAVTTRESGFYVLIKDSEIRAHSWAWRGDGGQLVIDGWETKDPEITAEKLAGLTRIMGEKFSDPSYDEYEITDMLLGHSNNKLNLEKFFEEAKNPARRFVVEWYYYDSTPGPDDFHFQWHVCRVAEPKRPDFKAPPLFKPTI